MSRQTEKEIEKQKERKSLATRSKIDFATHIVQISSAVKNAKKLKQFHFVQTCCVKTATIPFN
jgi:hypothetical protein